MSKSIHQLLAASAVLIFSLFGSAGSLQAACNTAAGVTTCTQANGQLVYQNSSGKFLPFSSDIVVSGVTGTVAKVTVTLNSVTSNAFGGDIEMMLVGPNGNNIEFLYDGCTDSTGFAGLTFTADDSGASTWTGTSTPHCNAVPNGTYKPFVKASPTIIGTWPSPAPAPTYAAPRATATFNTGGSAQFFGMAAATANGTWKLFVMNTLDSTDGTTTGSIGANAGTSPWTLTITSAVGTATSTTVASNLNPSFTSGTSSLVTLTATVTSSSTVNAGTVSFLDGVNTIACSGGNQTVVSGSATCQFTFPTEGAHVITADYLGGGSFSGSNSPPITQVVDNHTTPQSSPPAGTVGFCNTGAITIPKAGANGDESITGAPANPYASDIFVSGQVGIINALQVYLNGYTHSSPNVTGFMLVGPNGKNLDFFSEGGGGNQVNNLNLIFSDAGSSQVPLNSAPSSGTVYKPASYASGQPTVFCQATSCNGITTSEPAPSPFDSAAPRGGTGGYPGPGTLLGEFAGSSPNGTWQLFVVNRLGGFSGSVSSGWCINFTLANGHPTSTTLVSSLNPSFIAANGSTADLVTFTATVVNQDTPGGQINEGTVTFLDGVNTIGSGNVNFNGTANVATFSTNNPTVLTEGLHNIKATYNGTANFGFSSSNIVPQIVNRHTDVHVNAGNVYKYCNMGPMNVPAGGAGNPLADKGSPYPSNIFVTNLPGVTNHVTLSLNNYTSTFPNDMASLFVGPGGNSVDAIDFFSRVGGVNNVSGVNLTFQDGSGAVGTLNSNTSPTFQMTSGPGTNVWPLPAPTAGNFVYAAPQDGGVLSVFNVQQPASATWALYMQNLVNGAFGGIGDLSHPNSPGSDAWCVNFTETPPVLAVVKTHAGNFVQGQTATFTIQVTNNGPGPTGDADGAHPVTVTDTMPAGITVTGITATNWTCTSVFPASSITCTRHDAIAASNSYENIALTVKIDPAATPGLRTNTANASGGGAANASGNTQVTILVAPDMLISKVHNGTFTQGDTGDTYTITVSNAANTSPTLAQVTVVDTVPSGLTLTNAAGTNWSCSVTPPMFSCSRSDALASGASYEVITVTVNVANNAPTPIAQTATVSGGGEVITNNDSSTDNTPIVQLPDLTISKSHVGNFFQGQPGAQYTLTVHNISLTGPVVAGNTVTVADTLPSGLTPTNASGTGWSCMVAAPNVSCSRTDGLAANTNYPVITVTVNVANNAAAQVTNTATVATSPEVITNNNSASDITNINNGVDLTITKSHTGNFTQGDTGKTYTITVNNIGGTNSFGTITVVDTVPSGLTATAATGTGWGCVIASPTVTCTSSTVINFGGSGNAITLTVNVAGNATSPQVNQVTVSGGGDINGNNNSASDSTIIVQLPDLTIAKSHTGNFFQGQVGAVYNVTVTNSGTGPTSAAVTVSDTLPAGLTPTAASGTGWTCNINVQTVSCNRSDVLNSGQSYPVIQITVTVANNAAAQVTNTATVSGGGETNTGNDSSSDITNITGGPDLTIAKSHTGNFFQGQVGALYNVTATNSGASPTVGTVTVADTLPAGLTPTAAVGTGWGCNIVVQAVSCTRSDALASGQSYPVIQITVTVANNAPAMVTNTATVSGGGDVNGGNNSSSDPTTIVGGPDLTIAKSHTGNFTQGQVGAIYNVTVTNSGASATVGMVTVADTLPAGLTPTAAAGTGWTCNIVVQAVSCSRSDALGAGQSYPVIQITVTVAGNAPAMVTNTATVSGGGDVNGGNNSASDPTTINSSTNASLGANLTGKAGTPLSARQWSFNIINAGPGSANSALLTSFTLVQSGGTACSAPVVGTVSVNGGAPQSLPNVALGDIAANTSVPIVVNIDFGNCLSSARFTQTTGLSANSGASVATVVKSNQFP
jgi:uncharacterized repeat protein (TIGR01451 family)